MDTITVGSTVDFAVTIPYQLGYHPVQSITVVGFVAKRVLGIMRIDLCEPDRADVGARCLRTFVDAGVDGVIIVAFEARPSQGASLLRSFRAGAARHGIAVRDCLIIRGDQWFPVSATGHAQGRGRPVPDVSRVPAIAEFVARGRSPLPDRRSLSRLVADEGTALSREVGDRVRAMSSKHEQHEQHEQHEPTVAPASARAWQRLLGDTPPPIDDPGVVSAALVGLLDRGWRDGLLAWLCPDTLGLDLLREDVLAALEPLPRPAGSTDDGDLGGSGIGRAAGRGSDDPDPDDARVEPLGEEIGRRLFALCRVAPDEAGEVTAAILTVAAHVAWCDGDGTLASVALERALRLVPHYRLARLLDCLVAAGIRASDARVERSGSAIEPASRGDADRVA